MTVQIPAGYKQTEVGVIPEDWEVFPLDELVDFLDGQRKPIKDSDRARIRGEFPYYGASGVVDYINDYIFDEELILLGEDGENILSRNKRLSFVVSGKIWVNNHAHVLRVKKNTSISYLADYLESLNYEKYNSGTAQPKLNKKTCLEIPIALPENLKEQQAIAEALSDADALIESLEQLIAKKRQIKQGAMQELLTGQRRLPEFIGEWELIRMKDLLKTPATYGVVKAGDFVDDGVKMLRGGDIRDGYIFSDVPMISKEKSEEYSRTILSKNDVVISLVGYPGEAAKIKEDLAGLNISRAVGLLRLNYKVDPDYLVCFLNSIIGRKMVLAPSAGSAQQVVNLSELNNLEFSIPAVNEQMAISEKFLEIDREIINLKNCLEKYRQIKQGMMQELLTGRIRLI